MQLWVAEDDLLTYEVGYVMFLSNSLRKFARVPFPDFPSVDAFFLFLARFEVFTPASGGVAPDAAPAAAVAALGMVGAVLSPVATDLSYAQGDYGGSAHFKSELEVLLLHHIHGLLDVGVLALCVLHGCRNLVLDNVGA